MKFNYQQEVLTLPGAVLSATDADAVQLRVLLWLSSDLSLAGKPHQLARLVGCDPDVAEAAIGYWLAHGVIVEAGKTEVSKPATEKPVSAAPVSAKRTLVRRAEELPTYSSTELADILEQRESVRIMVDEAQRIVGKMFNPSEMNTLIGMLDYLSIPEEGILMILAHCKRIGKTNLRSIEKYAYSLADREITEPQALEEEFRTVEAMRSFEGEIRSTFGMKSRALTAKETKMLRAWVSFGYGIDEVKLAYDITVNATNEPSMAYANAILERWNAEGLKTVAEIEAAIEAERAEKAGTPTLGKSFDTDDLFEAALKRSFSWTESKE